MIQAAEPPAQVVATAPVYRPVEGLSPTDPLAVLIRSTADRNWKPVVQQVLSSWATMGVSPDCSETSVPADSIVARSAMESLPIKVAPNGEQVERGEALIRTVVPWCGADREINVLVFFHGGQWRGLNLSVGGTMTGPRLYMDILQQVTPRLIPVLNADSGYCRARYPQSAGRLTKTEMTSLTGDPLNPTQWNERWTWTACGRDTSLNLVMTVQPDGSTRFETSGVTPN
ncbi:MAG: hypothetical protein DI531_15640 [Brevundimonas sp.]|uniref:hypothetical protein n=1 Tax=Brevundimonas sp. TaxID=1871086 RepID=UPI000DB34CFB|nr:hypothetical protein [Brevundimonas sp.]PZU71559.1 MAG: hypothetical protein DI531_15640 [Brevundimonas sp.]